MLGFWNHQEDSTHLACYPCFTTALLIFQCIEPTLLRACPFFRKPSIPVGWSRIIQVTVSQSICKGRLVLLIPGLAKSLKCKQQLPVSVTPGPRNNLVGVCGPELLLRSSVTAITCSQAHSECALTSGCVVQQWPV